MFYRTCPYIQSLGHFGTLLSLCPYIYEEPLLCVYLTEMYVYNLSQDGEKLGYETEAFAIYDTMRYFTSWICLLRWNSL